MTMRLLTLLIMFALAFTNGAAMANAMCRHQDGQAHAAARTSSDQRVAAEAMSEDRARSTTSQKGSLTDAAATGLTGYVLPSEPSIFPLTLDEPMHGAVRDAVAPTSRSVPPLLEPPLAAI